MREGLEIASRVSDCLESAGMTTDFFEAVFRSEDPRSEWGGYHWTAQILGPFCAKIELTESGDGGGLSEYVMNPNETRSRSLSNSSFSTRAGTARTSSTGCSS